MAYKTKEQRKEEAAQEKRQDIVVSTHGPNCQCCFHRSERAKERK